MITTTGTYKELFNKGAIQEYLINIDGMDFYNNNLYGITMNENLFQEDTFCIGSCCASELQFVVKNTNFVIKEKAIVKFYYRYVSQSQVSEWIEKFEGKVTSTEITNNGKVNVTALNQLSYKEKYGKVVKSMVSFPTTARNLARRIAERMGLSLYNQNDIIDTTLYVDYKDDDELSDILKDIALLSCGNWAISQNMLKIVVHNNNLESVGMYSSGLIDNLGEIDGIDGISFYNKNDKTYTEGSVNENDTILQLESINATKKTTDYIYEKLENYIYKGYRNTRAYIDPAIEIGDYYAMASNEMDRQLCVMMNWIFDGSCICNVESPYQPIEYNQTAYEKTVEEEIEAALPFMVHDYNNNIENSSVGNELYVGMIPVNMSRGNVDVDAGFRTQVNMNTDSTIRLHYYRDGVEELFSPVEMSLTKGANLISDDHAYLNVSKGRHVFVSSIEYLTGENGTFSIPTRKTLYTIESSRIATRDLAIDGILIDMAFSSNVIESEQETYPKEVWLLTKKSDYFFAEISHFVYNNDNVYDVDIIKDTSAYVYALVGTEYNHTYEYVGDITAIDFMGHWEESKHIKNKKVFVADGYLKGAAICNAVDNIHHVVTKDKVLKLYNYNNTTNPLYDIENGFYEEVYDEEAQTTILVRREPTDVSIIQGWNFKGSISKDNNMGFVIAYIMNDGKLYYKTIVDDVVDVERHEITFPEEIYPLKNISTFRTNDYRIGFTVVGKNNVQYTAITDRYYQGDSIESTYLNSNFGKNNFEYGFGDYIDPQVIDGKNDNNTDIFIEFNCDLYGTIENITGIYLMDSSESQQKFEPKDGIIRHSETNNTLAFLVADSSTAQAYSVIQGFGIRLPSKGISDAVYPLYAVIENTNLKANSNYGGSEPALFDIPNQKSVMFNVKPYGTPFPSPEEELRVDIVSADFGYRNFSILFEEGGNYVLYDNEQQILESSFSKNNITFENYREVIKTNGYDNEQQKIVVSFPLTSVIIVEWKVISEDPV